MKILCGSDNACSENIATQDAAENIDEDGFHCCVAHQDAECVFHLIRGSAAADVEEIRGRTASVFDDVHGGHGKTGAVDHATDAAIELDVVEAVLGGFNFERIFFIEITQAAQILMTEEAVVVESHFRVERDEFSIACKDARIDFQHRSVRIHKRAMQRLEKWRGIICHFSC